MTCKASTFFGAFTDLVWPWALAPGHTLNSSSAIRDVQKRPRRTFICRASTAGDFKRLCAAELSATRITIRAMERQPMISTRCAVIVLLACAAAVRLAAQQNPPPAPAKPDSPAIIEQLDRLKKS